MALREGRTSAFSQVRWIPEDVCVNDYGPISSVYRDAMGDDFATIAVPVIKGIYEEQHGSRVEPILHLDVACGTGDVLVGLAKEMATRPIGIDICEGQLGAARALAAEAGVDLSLILGDARELVFPTHLDLVTMNLDAINHFTSPNEWCVLIEKTRLALKPGGFFIFDVNTPARLEEDWRHPEVIVKPWLTYVQCGLECWREGECTWRRLMMIIYRTSVETSSRHVAMIEQMTIPNAIVLQLLKKAGFAIVHCLPYEAMTDETHIFLKNRQLFVCQVPSE